MAKAMKKRLVLLLIVCMIGLASVLTACGSGNSNSNSNSTDGNQKASSNNSASGDQNEQAAEKVDGPPVEISIMSDFYSPEPPKDDDRIRKDIERTTNTKLNITWVSPNNYSDKTNVTLASGDMPDLLLIRDMFQSQVRKMADQGAFWDLTPYIKDYPNLNALPAESWKNTELKGKNYGIPFPRPLYGTEGMPIVRKDWLDQLGIEPPRSLDEIYNVLKAFSENDLDGNGKIDTIAMTAAVNQNNMGSLSWVEHVLNGNYGQWQEQGGKLIDMTFEPGTRDALVWLAKLYSEGLLAPDFPTLKGSQVREGITTSKSGMFSEALKPTWLLTGQMRATNPKADLLAIPYLEGPHGNYAPMGSGAWGFWVIPSTVPEEKMKQILAFMDYGASQEGSVLANFGIEGEHYTVQDGMYLFTEKASEYTGIIFPIFQSIDKYAFAYQTGIPADFLKRNMEIIDEQEKYAMGNPGTGLNSETYNLVGLDYAKRTQDLKTKIILGREPIEAWDSYVADLKADAQYQQIIAEMNEDYLSR
jgi:putative aldouronate transport system substrate-binding protein